jgi:uncharacterized protein
VIDSFFPQGWLHYLLGGVCIGAGVSLLYVGTGLIGGASSVFTSTLSWFSRVPYFQQARFTQSRDWRLVYAGGMILGALGWTVASSIVADPQRLTASLSLTQIPAWQLAVGGFIVGFGARLANGCTSGHGICGMASLRLPSLVAVLTFLATAFASAQMVLWVGGR